MSIFNKTQISKTLLYLVGGFAIATLFIPVTAGVAKASNGSDKVEVSDSNHSDSENHSNNDDEHASNDDEHSSNDDLPFDNHGEENEDEHSGSGTSGSGTSGSGAPGGGIPGGGTAGTPEPFTMLGAVSAIGFGVSFKRRLAKAKNDQKD